MFYAEYKSCDFPEFFYFIFDWISSKHQFFVIQSAVRVLTESCLREKHGYEKHSKSNHTCPPLKLCFFEKLQLFNLYMKAQSAIEPLSIGYLPIDVPWSVTCTLFIHAMTVNSQGKAEHRLTRTAKASGYILIPSLAPLPAAHNNL